MIDFTNIPDPVAKYRFVLEYGTESLTLHSAPLEWHDLELTLKRDPELHGVFLSSAAGSLTFIKEGRNLLKSLYEAEGVFAQCNLQISYLDYSERDYIDFPTKYQLDFNTYRLSKITKTTNGVQINALPVDTVTKFQQRKNTAVDLNKTTSIGGATITAGSFSKVLSLPAITIYRTGRHTDTSHNNFIVTDYGDLYVYPKQTLVFSDFTESQNVTYTEAIGLDRTKSLFFNASENKTLILNGEIRVDVNNIRGAMSRLQVGMYVIDEYDQIIFNIEEDTYLQADSGNKVITINETYSIQAGKSLIVLAIATNGGSENDIVNASFDGVDMIIKQEVESVNASLIESIPIYNALDQTLRLILDSDAAFGSDYLGGEGPEIPPSQTVYANIATGLNVRGMPIDGATFPVKFAELFRTVRSIWNVGATIEKSTGYYLRIEELAYFYANVQSLDLTGRVNEAEIEIEFNGEMIFSRVKSGYTKSTYEAISGRGEYNTQNERTTTVPNDTEFSNVAPYRADTRGILSLRLKELATTGSEDVTGDEDIFIIKTQADGELWKAETDENITIEDGTSLFNTGSLNLYMTPTRNIVRHGIQLSAGMPTGSVITFQTGDKNTILKTTGEGYTIRESDDIQVNNLTPAIWKPETVTFDCPLGEVDWNLISSQPHRYITVSSTISGWILEANWKYAQSIATFKLLRRC